MTTQQEFIANATLVRTQLADLDDQLQDQIQAIREKVFREKRDPTEEEKSSRLTLESAQRECRDAVALLADETLRQIDQSATIRNLRDRLSQVGARLQSDLDNLKHIQEIAAVAAQVADAVAKIVAAAAKLAAA